LLIFPSCPRLMIWIMSVKWIVYIVHSGHMTSINSSVDLPEVSHPFLPVKGFLGEESYPEPIWGHRGCRTNFVTCDFGLYKINWNLASTAKQVRGQIHLWMRSLSSSVSVQEQLETSQSLLGCYDRNTPGELNSSTRAPEHSRCNTTTPVLKAMTPVDKFLVCANLLGQ